MQILPTKEFTPEAVYFLKRTKEKDRMGAETVESIIEYVENDKAIMYYFYEEGLYGVLIVTVVEGYLTILTLGGREIKKWKNELETLLRKALKATNTKLLFVSRKGWRRLFPCLTEIGAVYSF